MTTLNITLDLEREEEATSILRVLENMENWGWDEAYDAVYELHPEPDTPIDYYDSADVREAHDAAIDAHEEFVSKLNDAVVKALQDLTEQVREQVAGDEPPTGITITPAVPNLGGHS